MKCKTIMLLVTYSCNLRCSYCYEPKTAFHQMSVADAKKYIGTILNTLDGNYDEFEVQFMGGEPLMAFEMIRDVSEWLWSHPQKIPLGMLFAATNGTLLNDEMKKWFTENKERFCLGLSYDGNQFMQDVNRSESSSLIDTDFFLNNWPNQSIKMTVSPQTLPHLYDGVVSLHSQGFANVAVDLAMGKNVLWEKEHLVIFQDQLNQLATFYIQHPDANVVSLLSIDISKVISRDHSSKKCGCGEDLITVDYDGQQYACHLFSPIATTKALAKMSQSIDFSNHALFISDECKECFLSPVCVSCYGMNYTVNGNVSRTFPFSCAAFKLQFKFSCQMQLAKAKEIDNNEKVRQLEGIINLLNYN